MGDIAAVVIGLGIGIALYVGFELGDRYFQRHPLSRRQYSVFFAVASTLCALWSIALWGIWWVFFGMLAISACLAWASIGTALEWPGFRPEPDPEGEEHDESSRSGCA
jgi:hypothetical protein